MILEQVKLARDLKLEDVRLIFTALEEEIAPPEPDQILWLIDTNQVQVWRFSAEKGHGIFLTRLLPSGEFFFWGYAGEGMLKHLEWIYEKFAGVAKQAGARYMTGIAKPALARIYERKLGFKTRNIQVVKEL